MIEGGTAICSLQESDNFWAACLVGGTVMKKMSPATMLGFTGVTFLVAVMGICNVHFDMMTTTIIEFFNKQSNLSTTPLLLIKIHSTE